MLFAIHLFGLSVTVAVSVVVARWIRRQTADPAGSAMVVLLSAHAVMAALVTAQLLVASLSSKIVLFRLWLSFVFLNPVIWLVFAVSYTGREYWLTRPVRAVLALYAVVPLAVFLTDPIHGLFDPTYAIAAEPFPHLQITDAGPIRPLFLIANAPILLGFGLLLRTHLSSRRATWWQTAALLVGMLAIFVPATVATTAYSPVSGFPYGVIGAGAFGVVVGVALFRNQMFGVAPLARDQLFTSLDDGVLIVDTQHRIVDYNDSVRSLLPDIDDRIGDGLAASYPSLVDEGTADRGGQTATYAAEQSLDPFAPTVDLPPEEPTQTLRVRVSPIESGGEPRGYALVFRDVTELESYAASLERKTKELERFASVLSHDLRNPLSVASGSIELEREARDSEHLERADDALRRIDETIGDLLTLAREGEAIDDPEPVALAAVVEDAWTTTETVDATLTVDVDDQLRLSADRSRLRTMLENLFRNAVEHGGDGVTVRVGALSDGFSVADDGPGIPPEERDQVFEYGYTGGDGTGFGLAIVDSIASAHGWELSVTEGERGGARFDVRGVDVLARDATGEAAT